MPTRDLTLAMIGSGGDGVVTMGEMMAQAGARDGLNVIKVEAYGPQIRGGESSCTLRMSAEPISAQGDAVDVLVVFNWADFTRFKGEVVPKADAVILYEAADPTPISDVQIPAAEKATWIPVPFIELATKATGTKAAKNIVTLGILAELFGIPPESVRRAVEFKFGKKKAGVLEANLKGFAAGREFAQSLGIDVSARRLEYTVTESKLVMTGNEACAVAAIHAGCRFFAGYPITPSSEVLHFLSEWLPRSGGGVIQTGEGLSAPGAGLGGAPGAKVLSANVTVISGAAPGSLRIYPADAALPVATTISFGAGKIRANNAMLLLSAAGEAGRVTVRNDAGAPLHLVVDVNGYFR